MIDHQKARQAVFDLLVALGQDPTDEGLAETPDRVVRAFAEHLAGYSQDPAEILCKTFDADGAHTARQTLVTMRDVEFASMCEHHLLPFTGVAHIAYVPGGSGRVVGISKLARVVECFARRLQLQERMTWQIADAVQTNLDALGCFVVTEATHSCMTCRGVKNRSSSLVATSTTGVFTYNPQIRAEVMQLLVERNHR